MTDNNQSNAANEIRGKIRKWSELENNAEQYASTATIASIVILIFISLIRFGEINSQLTIIFMSGQAGSFFHKFKSTRKKEHLLLCICCIVLTIDSLIWFVKYGK